MRTHSYVTRILILLQPMAFGYNQGKKTLIKTHTITIQKKETNRSNSSYNKIAKPTNYKRKYCP